MENLKLSPPWVQYANALRALFENDPDVSVFFDVDNVCVKLFVDSEIKANALAKLLPQEKVFGNVTMPVTVVPPNEEESKEKLFRDAFYGNDAVNEIWSTSEAFISNPITYVIFSKEVVQYYNDNLADAHGNRSTLYEEVARDVFGQQEGIFFCTDID